MVRAKRFTLIGLVALMVFCSTANALNSPRQIFSSLMNGLSEHRYATAFVFAAGAGLTYLWFKGYWPFTPALPQQQANQQGQQQRQNQQGVAQQQQANQPVQPQLQNQQQPVPGASVPVQNQQAVAGNSVAGHGQQQQQGVPAQQPSAAAPQNPLLNSFVLIPTPDQQQQSQQQQNNQPIPVQPTPVQQIAQGVTQLATGVNRGAVRPVVNAVATGYTVVAPYVGSAGRIVGNAAATAYNRLTRQPSQPATQQEIQPIVNNASASGQPVVVTPPPSANLTASAIEREFEVIDRDLPPTPPSNPAQQQQQQPEVRQPAAQPQQQAPQPPQQPQPPVVRQPAAQSHQPQQQQVLPQVQPQQQPSQHPQPQQPNLQDDVDVIIQRNVHPQPRQEQQQSEVQAPRQSTTLSQPNQQQPAVSSQQQRPAGWARFLPAFATRNRVRDRVLAIERLDGANRQASQSAAATENQVPRTVINNSSRRLPLPDLTQSYHGQQQSATPHADDEELVNSQENADNSDESALTSDEELNQQLADLQQEVDQEQAQQPVVANSADTPLSEQQLDPSAQERVRTEDGNDADSEDDN